MHNHSVQWSDDTDRRRMRACADTEGPLGGPFGADLPWVYGNRSASRRPFSGQAGHAVGMLNITAIDIHDNLARFVENIAAGAAQGIASAAGAAKEGANKNTAKVVAGAGQDAATAVAAVNNTVSAIASNATSAARNDVAEAITKANKTDAAALLPASRGEVQQQDSWLKAGEDELRTELQQQNTAIKAELTQQNVRLRQQDSTIDTLVKQVNALTPGFNGTNGLNGTQGPTGGPSLTHTYLFGSLLR